MDLRNIIADNFTNADRLLISLYTEIRSYSALLTDDGLSAGDKEQLQEAILMLNQLTGRFAGFMSDDKLKQIKTEWFRIMEPVYKSQREAPFGFTEI